MQVELVPNCSEVICPGCKTNADVIFHMSDGERKQASRIICSLCEMQFMTGTRWESLSQEVNSFWHHNNTYIYTSMDVSNRPQEMRGILNIEQVKAALKLKAFW